MTNFLKQHEKELQERMKKDAKELQLAKMYQAIYDGLELKDGMQYALCGYPDKMPYISEHTAYADAFAEFEAVTIEDAFNIMNQYDLLNVYECHDSCLSIRPETHLKGKRDDFTKTGKQIAPYYCRVEGLLGQKEEKTLKFYVSVAGYTVEIRLKLYASANGYSENWRSYRIQEYRGGRRVEDTRCKLDRRYFSNYYKMGRGTDEHPNEFRLYMSIEKYNENQQTKD